MIKFLRYCDKKLLLYSLILFAWGLIMIYSASNVTAYMNEAYPGRYFMKELLFLGLGLIISFIICKFHTKSYSFLSWVITFILAGIIACLALYGTAVNGAYNWIGYNGFGIQPSEFIKVSIIVLLATYYEKNIKDNDDIKKMLFPYLFVFLIFGFIVLQKDYGTALIFLCVTIFIFFISPVSPRIKKIVFGVGSALVILFLGAVLIFQDKLIPMDKLQRFDYFDPCSKYLTTGNQLCNGYIAINGGGLLGKGLGNSTQKYLYLPEAHTDFIFAILVEELGIVGGIALFVLYFLLLVRIVAIGKKAKKESHKMICYGIVFFIFLHIAVNIGGVLGLIPITGVPLPFISYGGSICWSLLISLAIVQRIAYETNKSLAVKTPSKVKARA